jgi:C4-dicarboxylate-binding protein DctP
MKMKIAPTILVVLLIAVLLSVGIDCAKEAPAPATPEAPAPATPEVTIILNNSHPVKGDPEYLMAEYIKKRWEEVTNGRVEVKVYHFGTLYTQYEQIPALLEGGCNLCHGGTYLINAIDPMWNVTLFPMLYKDRDHFMAWLQTKPAQELVKQTEESGFKILFWTAEVESDIWATRPIKTIEDWKGLKIRIAPMPILVDCMETLGATPVSVRMEEFSTAVEQHMVDSAITFIRNCPVIDCTRNLPYATREPIGGLPMLFYVTSNEFWNSLPEDLREAMESTFPDLHEYAIKTNDEVCERMWKEFTEDPRTTVTYITTAERQRWLELLQPVMVKYLDELDACDLYNAAVELRPKE